jgi:hypothetical protein
MRLATALLETMSGAFDRAAEALESELSSEVIRATLNSAGHRTKRRRRLPTEVVVWLVIGMALFRDRCIEAVAEHLRIGRRSPDEPGPAKSALMQARARVGPDPLAAVFDYTATEWALRSATQRPWRGLSVFGIDGTTLRVADTVENEQEFGRPGSSRPDRQAAYPQVRLVALMAVRSHLIAGARLAPYKTGETTMAQDLWATLPDNSLVIKDRGFVDYRAFHVITQASAGNPRNRHFLIRAKSNLRWKVLKRLGHGDELVEITISRNARRKDPALPTTMIARVVHYQRKGFRPQKLITSLIDAETYPAAEIRELYHERWELELGYDEVKTHTLDREESLRSKSPEAVEQEVWGLLLAYNLVRRQIERFADQHDLPPRRISYRGALLLIRNICLCAATGVGSVQKLFENMEAEMRLLVLPERRKRQYRRAVKIKMSSYPRNTGRTVASHPK